MRRELHVEHLADLFGIADLGERLAAVDEKMGHALSQSETSFGPGTLQLAATGGKRLRPLFVVACAAVGDVFDERVVAAAAAVELVQLGALIHDDVLDDAATRRGRPTINALEGPSHAVLAGDYVLARAAELAASVSREVAEVFASTVAKVCEGQVCELRDAYDLRRSVDAYLAAVRGKTAALFASACQLGAQCGRLSPDSARALARFGDAFGTSFQLLDDVLDLIGDPERIGKPTGSDIASGVYTLPLLMALQGPLGDELRQLLAARTDGDRGERTADLGRIVELVLASGSIATTLATVDRYADTARRAVSHLDQTTVGTGLAAFPQTYSTWALETFMDPRFRELPVTAAGR